MKRIALSVNRKRMKNAGARFMRSIVFAAISLGVMTSTPVRAEDSPRRALLLAESGAGYPLSLANFVALVAERNHQLQIRDTDLVMKREGINAARGIYEPALVGSYSHYYNNEQNTAEQIVARNSLVYEVEADYYKLEIEGLLPTGAQYKFGFGLTESNDNLLLFGQKEIDRQYKEISYVNLTQPLLKNFGIAATETQIRLAEGDADLAVQSYRQEMLNVVGRAIATYWDLTLAKEKVKLRAESVQVAEKILDDNRARLKTGKMAETEVLEAEAGVALRKALEIDAKKQYVVAENDALTMFAEHAAAYPAGVDVTEPLIVESIPYDYHTSITRAFELRPEYMASQQRLSQERVRLAYAENQRWPELDLKASYGLNGLNYDRSDAWDDMESSDYDTWSVGVELRIPLFGDEKTASELAQVKQRKRKALLEMKAIEVALANAVNTAIRNLKSTTEQADYSASVAKLNNRLLEVELLRLNAGKSNSRLVLEKEDDFRSAREAELEALIDQRKAVLELEMAEGSLLSRYNIDVMERDL